MIINTLLLVLLNPILGAAAALAKAEINDELRFDALKHLKRSEEADFTPGFLIPTNISLQDYNDFKDFMIPVTSLPDNEWDLLGPESDTLSADDGKRVIIPKRQSEHTRVLVGVTQVDYGCDASIRLPLLEAINSLCGNGRCDPARTYTRQVKVMDQSPIRDATLSINIEGRYIGQHTRGYISNLVENLVTPKTALPAWREYYQQIGQHVRHHACSMSKFSNYIAIEKDFGDVVDIRISISLNTSNNFCIPQATFFEVLFAINNNALGFFRSFIPSCVRRA